MYIAAARGGVVADRRRGTGTDNHLVVVDCVGPLSPCQSSAGDINHNLSRSITTERPPAIAVLYVYITPLSV